MNDKTKDICISALNKLSEANSAMIGAIETSVKEITDNGKKTILFRNEVDCATCDPLVQLDYNKDDDSVYITSETEVELSLDDLTANELFEIVNLLMAKNYQLYDKE